MYFRGAHAFSKSVINLPLTVKLFTLPIHFAYNTAFVFVQKTNGLP